MLKRILIGFPAFLATFVVGLLFFEGLTSFGFLTGSSQNCTSTTNEGTPTLGYSAFPVLSSTNSPRYSMQLVDLFEHGTVFKTDEFLPGMDAEWFGLFESNGTSSIEPVRIRVNTQYYGVQIGAEDRNDVPIFIFSGSNSLKTGEVATLYHRPSKEEISGRHLPLKSMSIGYSEHFNLGQEIYELRVVPGTTVDGTKLNALVLESRGVAQTLVYNRHYDRADRIGDLLWVGDLDGDGKLDLYFDDFDFGTGKFGSNLFLSSEAEPGLLVKHVGFFDSRKN